MPKRFIHTWEIEEISDLAWEAAPTGGEEWVRAFDNFAREAGYDRDCTQVLNENSEKPYRELKGQVK